MSMPDATQSDTDENDEDLEERVEKLESIYERELQAERERRKEAEEELEAYRNIFDFRRKTEDGIEDIDPENASLKDVWIANSPVGEIIVQLQHNVGNISNSLHELAGVTPEETENKIEDDNKHRRLKMFLENHGPQNSGNQDSVVRDDIHNAHRWMIDINQNGGVDRKKEQKRVGHLFRRFVRKAAGETETGVDASGQAYSVTTSAATDILVAEGQLDTVKKQSYSQTVARVMRDAQRETSYDVDCQCEDVDECAHALLEFNPGKPHTLSVHKDDLEDYISEYIERVEMSESDDGGNSFEDSVSAEANDDLLEKREELDQAEVVRE